MAVKNIVFYIILQLVEQVMMLCSCKATAIHTGSSKAVVEAVIQTNLPRNLGDASDFCCTSGDYLLQSIKAAIKFHLLSRDSPGIM